MFHKLLLFTLHSFQFTWPPHYCFSVNAILISTLVLVSQLALLPAFSLPFRSELLLLKSLGPLYFSSDLPPPLFIPASISVSPSPGAAAFPDEDGVSIHIHYGHFAPERDGRGDVGWKLGRGREGEMEDVIPH